MDNKNGGAVPMLGVGMQWWSIGNFFILQKCPLLACLSSQSFISNAKEWRGISCKCSIVFLFFLASFSHAPSAAIHMGWINVVCFLLNWPMPSDIQSACTRLKRQGTPKRYTHRINQSIIRSSRPNSKPTHSDKKGSEAGITSEML